MLRRTRKRLYVAPTETVLAEVSRDRVVGAQHAQLRRDDALLELSARLRDWAKPYLRVHEIVVSDEWCRFFIVRPPARATRPGDLTFAAEDRFKTLYDEPPREWTIRADWHATRPFLACAMYKPLLAVLDGAPLRNVSQVVPQMVHYYARHAPGARRGRSWLVSCGPRRLTLAVTQDRACTDVHQLPVASHTRDLERSFEEFVESERLRLNQPAPDDIVLCGTIPLRWRESRMEGARVTLHPDPVLANA